MIEKALHSSSSKTFLDKEEDTKYKKLPLLKHFQTKYLDPDVENLINDSGYPHTYSSRVNLWKKNGCLWGFLTGNLSGFIISIVIVTSTNLTFPVLPLLAGCFFIMGTCLGGMIIGGILGFAIGMASACIYHYFERGFGNNLDRDKLDVNKNSPAPDAVEEIPDISFEKTERSYSDLQPVYTQLPLSRSTQGTQETHETPFNIPTNPSGSFGQAEGRRNVS